MRQWSGSYRRYEIIKPVHWSYLHQRQILCAASGSSLRLRGMVMDHLIDKKHAWLHKGLANWRADFTKTFSPVIKFTTVWVVLAIAVTQGWCLRQLDINNAFLHGDLLKSVYMSQLPRYKDPHRPDHVCLLHQFIYGLCIYGMRN